MTALHRVALPHPASGPAGRPAPSRAGTDLVERVFARITEAAVEDAPFPRMADMVEAFGAAAAVVQRAVETLKVGGRIQVEWRVGRCRACVEGLWTDWSEPPRHRDVA